MNKGLAAILIAIMIVISGCSNNGSSSAQTGVYQGKAIEGIAGVAWTFASDFNGQLSPLIIEDTTYFGDSSRLYAVDTGTGEQKWTHQIQGPISKPAVADGIVSYIDKTGIHALNSESGELVWERDYNKGTYDSNLALSAGSSKHMFIIELLEDGRRALKALDIETGKDSWSFGDNISPNRVPLVVNDKLYIPSVDQVHVLNERSGKETDSIKLDAMIDSISVRDNLMVAVFADGDRSIHGFDLKSHDHKWEYVLSSEDGIRPSRLEVIQLDDKVLLTDIKSGTVAMLDSKGNELWKEKFGNPVFGVSYGSAITPPVIAEDVVYLSILEGQHKELKGFPGYSSLLAVDANTGNEQWRYQENDYIEYSPSLIDNGMVVVTKDGIKAYKGGKNIEGPN